MELRIFNVDHGACALLLCDDGATMMIDCGHDSATGWKPGKYLKSIGIAALDMLAITNYDEEHLGGIEDLIANVHVRRLWRNRHVDAGAIKRLKRRNEMGRGVDYLVWLLDNVFSGPPGNMTPRLSPEGRSFSPRDLAASSHRSERLVLSTSALMSVVGSNLPQRIFSVTNQASRLFQG